MACFGSYLIEEQQGTAIHWTFGNVLANYDKVSGNARLTTASAESRSVSVIREVRHPTALSLLKGVWKEGGDLMKLTITCLILSTVSCFPAYGARRVTRPNYMTVRRVEYGLASWYGDHEQGRLMASGVPFNQYAMIAAHRTLPMGTTVRVTNVRNGRSVVVRIMDRGPHVAGRAIDLSKAAAERLQFTHQGLAHVSMRVLSTPDQQRRATPLTRHTGRRHRSRVSPADG